MRQNPGIYMISVVAETLAMHPQTLRKYERAGFVEPLRMGTLRTYSDEDVARLRLIKHFVDDLGLNLSGVELALNLTSSLLDLRAQITSGDTTSESLERVDEMLETLGLKVVEQPKTEEPPLPEPGDAWFKVNPGQSVEFSGFATESANP